MSETNEIVKAILNELSSTNLKQIHLARLGNNGKNNDLRIQDLLQLHWSENEIKELKKRLRDQMEAQRPWMARITSISGNAAKDTVAISMRNQSASFNGIELEKDGFYNVVTNGEILTCQYWMRLDRAIVIDSPNGLDIQTITIPEMVRIRIDFSKGHIFFEEKDWWKTQRGIKVLEAVGVHSGSTGLSGVETTIANQKMKSFIIELEEKLKGEDKCQQ